MHFRGETGGDRSLGVCLWKIYFFLAFFPCAIFPGYHVMNCYCPMSFSNNVPTLHQLSIDWYFWNHEKLNHPPLCCRCLVYCPGNGKADQYIFCQACSNRTTLKFDCSNFGQFLHDCCFWESQQFCLLTNATLFRISLYFGKNKSKLCLIYLFWSIGLAQDAPSEGKSWIK